VVNGFGHVGGLVEKDDQVVDHQAEARSNHVVVASPWN